MSDIGDNTQNRGDIPTPHVAENIAGEDDIYGSESDEVILKNMNIPQDMITRSEGGRRSPAVACLASDHWVAISSLISPHYPRRLLGPV